MPRLYTTTSTGKVPAVPSIVGIVHMINVVLAFVIIGFTSKFQRNENFFKVLFISISIGFFIFFLKEIISKLTINLSINIYFSYLVIFLIPLFIGLYQVIKIENE